MSFLKKVKSGANKTLKTVSVGAFKGAKSASKFAGSKIMEYQESQKPQNRLKSLRMQTAIAREEAKLRRLQPKKKSNDNNNMFGF